jgi:hypothetical protein
MENWLLIKISTFSGWFSSIFGSALALYFSRAKVVEMKKWEVLFVFVAGVLIGHWIGGGVASHFHISPDDIIADGVKLAMALTGMGLLAKLHEKAPIVLDGIMNRGK